jgi:hypothetical protein
MSTIITTGSVTFGDNTVLSTGTPAYSTILGAPTVLSAFTNNLGNYGGFYSSANVDGTQTAFTGAPWFQFQIVAGKVRFAIVNCNCQCNC